MQANFSDIVLPDRVHKKVFIDPEIFELEMDRIFRRTWVYLGHESEIPETGDFIRTWIGLASIILVRADDGQINGLINACRHRGAVVCDEARGNKRHFQCPYHGWTYDTRGALVGVPIRGGQRAAFQPEVWGLHRVPRIESYRGFCFGSMNPGVNTLEEHLGDAREFIDLFVDLSPSGKILVNKGATKYEYRGNWKQQVENSMDGYHPGLVHHTFLEDILTSRIGSGFGWITGPQSPGESCSFHSGHGIVDYRFVDRTKMMGSAAARTQEEVIWHDNLVQHLGEERAHEVIAARGGDGFNLLVYPNMFLINCQIRVVRPIAVDHTEVYAYPTMLEGVDPSINEHRLRGHEDFYGPAAFGAPDDIEMFVRQWEALAGNPEFEWLLYERGIEREKENDGVRVSHISDETAHRGIWRRWKELMES